MPKYVYQIVFDNGDVGEQFEVFQKMSDEPLTEHPETGQAVRRVLQPPNISGAFNEERINRALGNDQKLEKLGFTKYVNNGQGYDKVCGEGPDLTKKK
ncbi:MAG: zinc ribbon domain-containing protein [Pirellulaceae bacterium]|nr:zinc ribbon domain-containing protein [Pirellulaceae bacterium]MDP7016561.1 zinc ribbon domain-containing protein [Pirellulaceae bacterium]